MSPGFARTPCPGPRSRAWPLACALLLGACAQDRPGRLLVTSGFTDQVFVLDAASGRVLDSVSLDRRPGERDEPHGVAVAADGRHWYVTLSHGEPSLWKYEVLGNRLVGRLTLDAPGASRVRLSPDGTLAAIPDYWLGGRGTPSGLSVVRTHDLSLVGTRTVCAAPHDAAFSPDGTRIAVTCALGDEVVVLDARSLEVEERIPLHEFAPPAGTARPMNVAWSADGDVLHVSLMGAGGFVSFGAGQATLERTGARPAQMALSPDGARLIVANRGDRTVAGTALRSGSSWSVELPGAHPHGVAFGTDPGLVYVTYEGDTRARGGVVALDARDGALVWHTRLGIFTLGIAYLAG